MGRGSLYQKVHLPIRHDGVHHDLEKVSSCCGSNTLGTASVLSGYISGRWRLAHNFVSTDQSWNWKSYSVLQGIWYRHLCRRQSHILLCARCIWTDGRQEKQGCGEFLRDEGWTSRGCCWRVLERQGTDLWHQRKYVELIQGLRSCSFCPLYREWISRTRLLGLSWNRWSTLRESPYHCCSSLKGYARAVYQLSLSLIPHQLDDLSCSL